SDSVIVHQICVHPLRRRKAAVAGSPLLGVVAVAHLGNSCTRSCSGHSAGFAPALSPLVGLKGCPLTTCAAPSCFTNGAAPMARHCAMVSEAHHRSNGRAFAP